MLTPEQITTDLIGTPESHPFRHLMVEAVRKVVSEVRKDDEALIRQLWDLVQSQHDYIMALPADVVASLPAMPGFDGDWADEVKSAARARLEKTP